MIYYANLYAVVYKHVNHLKQQTQNTGHGKALFPGKRVQQQEIYHIACLKQNVG